MDANYPGKRADRASNPRRRRDRGTFGHLRIVARLSRTGMERIYSIAYMERSTGISRETLRIWERRYGFPNPGRDAAGDRSYSRGELERLRIIKRLLDQGHRPGRIVPLEAAALRKLATVTPAHPSRRDTALHTAFIGLLRQREPDTAREWLQLQMSTQGLAGFIRDTLAPLITAIGDAWGGGQLSVFEEHLFTELTQRLLRQAIGALPPGGAPRVLLTTLPEEQHSLGLLMAEAILTLEGARCLSLGVNTPTPEVVTACRRHEIDILALSFSLAYPRRRIAPQLAALRTELPTTCDIWAGGACTARLRALPGVRYCPRLEDASRHLEQWRKARRT